MPQLRHGAMSCAMETQSSMVIHHSQLLWEFACLESVTWIGRGKATTVFKNKDAISSTILQLLNKSMQH